MAYEGREETRVKNSREGKGEKLMSKVALNASEMMSSCGKNHMPALTLKSALPLIGCEITPSLNDGTRLQFDCSRASQR